MGELVAVVARATPQSSVAAAAGPRVAGVSSANTGTEAHLWDLLGGVCETWYNALRGGRDSPLRCHLGCNQLSGLGRMAEDGLERGHWCPSGPCRASGFTLGSGVGEYEGWGQDGKDCRCRKMRSVRVL